MANIGGSNAKEIIVAKRTEYLITHYASDGSILKQLRAPKSVNLRLLLERLGSRPINRLDVKLLL